MDFTPPGPEAKVFVISVAAELSGLHPQTLRTYDRLGIVEAGRTGGGGRRYSLRDIELLRTVARLTAEGLGLEGVKRVIELENQVAALQEKVAELQAELATAHQALGTVQNLPVLAAQTHLMLWRRSGR
ncbi:heat shock protein transcriptional repressor HspR [Aeromicrobium sp. CTD01-1L150]|uniref:heat shock protein transcriptional repressor HspR n=1 Tax=Aeromicrobium sp. CTD01-1L150 TaxID=3341830 RepID=UPI0035C015CE